jgi:hypothetical protein
MFTDVNQCLRPASAIPDKCPGDICGEADHQTYPRIWWLGEERSLVGCRGQATRQAGRVAHESHSVRLGMIYIHKFYQLSIRPSKKLDAISTIWSSGTSDRPHRTIAIYPFASNATRHKQRDSFCVSLSLCWYSLEGVVIPLILSPTPAL